MNVHEGFNEATAAPANKKAASEVSADGHGNGEALNGANNTPYAEEKQESGLCAPKIDVSKEWETL